ncbi:Sm-like ribonucleoprotein [Microthyrium microscopicum]|uniref:Small nuclear ribonucleoprotein E n=1 Tax=Microthyrium microscopicum TaxID=703497 RepID=A0A6A6UK45_9PEZI|nr:Sm-like ribonucleoprotein [Microthyrium microscopicum]
MAHRHGGGQRGKVLLPPINFIFRILQQQIPCSIWLYEQLNMRIEGKIRGFDEFMNLVVDDAVEVILATKAAPETKKPLGRILLKGDNVSLIQMLTPQ